MSSKSGGSSTCLMFWPTYSITISSAAMGSMANRPHSWILLRPKRSFFLRNCIGAKKKKATVLIKRGRLDEYVILLFILKVLLQKCWDEDSCSLFNMKWNSVVRHKLSCRVCFQILPSAFITDPVEKVTTLGCELNLLLASTPCRPFVQTLNTHQERFQLLFSAAFLESYPV